MRTLDPIKHAENRNRIVIAARKLFAAQGVAETSMAQIAKACRVTKATLYHYFKGKENILESIFNLSLEEHDRFVESIRVEGGLEKTLEEVGRRYMEILDQPSMLEMMRIFQNEGMKSSVITRHYVTRNGKRMENYLRMGVEKGVLPDTDPAILRNVVFTFFGALEHHFVHAHVLKCEFSSGGDEGYIRFLAKMFSRTLEAIRQMALEGQIPKGGVTTP